MIAKSTIRTTKAFTLIELLVVISIIALLMSIVLPGLRRAKELGKRTVCLSNVRSLTMAYLLYAENNHGKVVECGTIESWVDMVAPPYAQVPMEAPEKLQIESLENGDLYPYVGDIDVYRCPIAQKEEFRTYSVSAAMGFPSQGVKLPDTWGEVTQKISQVKNASSKMVFLDDYCENYNAVWFVPATADFWWNSIPIRHGSGGNVFSFVDGHSEFKKWNDDRTIELAKLCFSERTPEARDKPGNAAGEQADNEDLIWAARAQWGSIKNR